MKDDQIEKAIEFLLNQQARADAATIEMRESITRMSDKVGELSDKVSELSDKVSELSDNVSVLVEQSSEDRAAVIEANAEIKERLNVLISVMETTTALAIKTDKLAEEAYAIARASEQRLALLEGRTDKIENRLTE